MKRIEDETPSLLDRLFGAALATLFALGTVIMIPWLMAGASSLRSGVTFPLIREYAKPGFFLWASLVAFFSMVIGYVYGTLGVLDVFNQIWETGDTTNKELRELGQAMKVMIPMTGLISLVLAAFS